MNNLFESASLRAAGISRVPPSKADKARVALLALPLKKNPLTNLKGEDSTSVGLVSTSRPKKWIRGELAPEELDSLRSRAAKVAAKLTGPSAAAKKEKLDKKRRRLDRGQGPSGTSGPAVPPPPQQSEVIIIDEASPPKYAEGEQAAEAEAQAKGSSAHAILPEPTQRPGKEPVGTRGTAGEETAFPQPAVELPRADVTSASESDFRWPFRHSVSELRDQAWDQFSAKLIGEMRGDHAHREVFPEGDRFIARRPHDKESSVLESCVAQIPALE